jgi:hypothetical protein
MSSTDRYRIGGAIALFLILCGAALLHFGAYGWTLFVVFPILLGGLASWVLQPATDGKAAGLGALTAMASACFLLILGLEGMMCLLMALPLVTPLGALGGWLAYRAGTLRQAASGVAMLVLLLPGTLAWDVKAPPQVFEVRTAITVAATPEQVWKHVVTFSELPEPQEWYFRAGVAYPTRARIDGSGPGAIRYCEFSTGPFVEPIVFWDQPHLLSFNVAENPAPLNEWSPYGRLATKHLHGYLVSKRGQFRLTRLANGGTLLEGTTWYQHGLWPAEYWKWWSDAIVHRIHLRVLNHVRMLAEQGSKPAW